jgi:hypothetical protein
MPPHAVEQAMFKAREKEDIGTTTISARSILVVNWPLILVNAN